MPVHHRSNEKSTCYSDQKACSSIKIQTKRAITKTTTKSINRIGAVSCGRVIEIEQLTTRTMMKAMSSSEEVAAAARTTSKPTIIANTSNVMK